jgi:nifR3 family TIM-barrel protein
MNRGFWGKLNKKGKITALAPMANVTDAAFRRIIAKYGKPDVMYTEFVSCEGLLSAGREVLLNDLIFSEKERPIVAQVFGAKPKQFYECAKLVKKLGFDGIDINMGCPDRAVAKQGAGAALIKNPKLAREIIKEAKRGAGRMPVSVKTRIGDVKNELKTWLPNLLKAEPAAIIIHARTRKEMSLVPANWKTVSEAVKIRDKYKSKTLILGNGDVTSFKDAYEKAKETEADGIMVGRGIFGNPWFFNPKIDFNEIAPQIKIKVLLEHAVLFEKIFGKKKTRPQRLSKQACDGGRDFNIMKKHFKAYINGFPGAKELRVKAMEAKNAGELKKILRAV